MITKRFQLAAGALVAVAVLGVGPAHAESGDGRIALNGTELTGVRDRIAVNGTQLTGVRESKTSGRSAR
jgi:hypothetical protein